MHAHLYIKKNVKKVHFNNESFSTVKYECLCGDWWKRRVSASEIAPKYWEWELFTDREVKLEKAPVILT